MELRKKNENDSMSAVITSRNCDNRALVLCSQDVLQIPIPVEKKKISCLQPNRTSPTSNQNHGKRRKRDTESK